MSQDHLSPLPPPSYENRGVHGTADRPTYPRPAPVRPPLRWRDRPLTDGSPTADVPGHGGPATQAHGTPAHGTPAPPARGYGAPGYGAAEPPAYGGAGEGFGAPAASGHPDRAVPHGFGPAHGAPTAGGFGGPAPAPRFAPPETPGHGGRSSGLGAAAAPVYGAPAPAHPAPPGGYGAPHAPHAPGLGAPDTGGFGAPVAPGLGAPDTTGYGDSGPAPASWSSRDGREPGADGYSNPAVHHQIRQAVVHRVQYANALHASHYWDLRRTKPVGPHALVFLYASLDPRFADPRRPYYEINAASRLFRDGSEVQDLPALLAELCEIAEGYLAGGGVFDPVAQMTQAGEPMPAEARYVGVSVSTLLGGGDEAGAEAPGVGGMGIPGRNLVVMSDDNLLVVERPARAHEQVVVHSTSPHFTGGVVEYRSWLPLSPEQQVHPAWRWLQRLNQLVLTGQERKTAVVGAMGGRRPR
ncbi:hypothetical protein ABZV78_28465 [Micromonospora sp. NPDC004540]|uniref:hypothetical protein n=1 Tax=Micromonospora sp. NPDC004540 TaxID=3154457 RepID=UPI0033B56C23